MLGNYLSLFHHYSFVTWRMLYKWNHAIYNSLRLVSCTQYNIFEIYPSVMYISCFSCLLLSKILLHRSTIIYLFIHSLKSIGLIVSFWLNVAMKIYVQFFYVNLSFYLFKINTKKFDCWVVWKCILCFLRHCHLFSKVAAPLIPSAARRDVVSCQYFSIFNMLFSTFNFSHSSRCVLVSSWGFDLHFPNS